MIRGVLRLVLVGLGVASLHAAGATPAVSAGDQHSLALHADGSLRAWGDDSGGALGTGRALVRLTPGVVPNFQNASAVAAGAVHTLALTRDGHVWSWGFNG